MNQEKGIRVIGFITSEIEEKYLPVPDNYLSSEKDMPTELIEDLKLNGWQDRSGNLWWGKDFQPNPVKGNDGNIYLCLSDADMEDPERSISRMMLAQSMLH